mgnify:CR=1 FL=1
MVVGVGRKGETSGAPAEPGEWKFTKSRKTDLSMWLDYLGLLTDICWSQAPTFPQRLGVRGAIFCDYSISKKWIPGTWKRYSWVVEMVRARRLTLPRGRERIYTSKFSKVNTLRKRDVRGQCQKETCARQGIKTGWHRMIWQRIFWSFSFVYSFSP